MTLDCEYCHKPLDENGFYLELRTWNRGEAEFLTFCTRTHMVTYLKEVEGWTLEVGVHFLVQNGRE